MATIRRRAHCRPASRFAGRDYLVRIDPFDAFGNAQLVERCNRELARWKANRALAEQQARDRAMERHYAKERAKWDRFKSAPDPEETRAAMGLRPLAGGLGRPAR